MKPLSTLIKKIEQILRQNQRNVPLLDMMLMILVIPYGILKIKKSLGVEMSYSMIRSCIKISCGERNRKKKQEYTVLDEIIENEIPKVTKNQNLQQ